ncbi:hypothetical protein HDV03_002574, partial [Kappamyces sp. JEL0829]
MLARIFKMRGQADYYDFDESDEECYFDIRHHLEDKQLMEKLGLVEQDQEKPNLMKH